MGSVLTKVTSPTSKQLLPSLVQIIFGALYKTSILVSDSVFFKLLKITGNTETAICIGMHQNSFGSNHLKDYLADILQYAEIVHQTIGNQSILF